MRHALALWLVAAALVATSCDDGGGGPGPTIDRIAPPQARVGDVIDILGERFCSYVRDGAPPIDAGGAGGPCDDAFVTFGTAPGIEPAVAEAWTDTRITVRVPQLVTGPTSILVTVNGRQSEVADFEVIE
jgi:hypothetical protein